MKHCGLSWLEGKVWAFKAMAPKGKGDAKKAEKALLRD